MMLFLTKLKHLSKKIFQLQILHTGKILLAHLSLKVIKKMESNMQNEIQKLINKGYNCENFITPKQAQLLGLAEIVYTYLGIGDELLLREVAKIYYLRTGNKLLVTVNNLELFVNIDFVHVLNTISERNLNKMIQKELRENNKKLDFIYIDTIKFKIRFIAYHTFRKINENHSVWNWPNSHIITQLASCLGLNGNIEINPKFDLLDVEKDFGKFSEKEQICIMSAGVVAYKSLPLKITQKIVDSLCDKYQFIQIGTLNDPAVNNVINLQGKLSLRETAATLYNSKLFVGTIGALMHLAKSVDCKSVIAFSCEPLHFEYYEGNHYVFSRTPCDLCATNKLSVLYEPCPYDYKCIKNFETNDMISEIKKALWDEKEIVPHSEVIKPNIVLGLELEIANLDLPKITEHYFRKYNIANKNISMINSSQVISEKIKLIAVYLPQFHPIPENDKWWGKGFTEWTNVAKAQPRFEGHYQPHLPTDLGFYDLRLNDVQIEQAELAKRYGIHGFCYYHYWFHGKRLLETPIENMMKTGKPDFPFCLCWANHDWSNTWDTGGNKVLMKQTYSTEDDLNHIKVLIEYFKDKRYIRVNNKPLFFIWSAKDIPDVKTTISIWRSEAKKYGLELCICKVERHNDEGGDPISDGFDCTTYQQPDRTQLPTHKDYSVDKKVEIYNYEDYAKNMINKPTPKYKFYPSICVAFDNSPRRVEGYATVFKESSPDKYQYWLEKTIEKVEKDTLNDDKIILLNAWNEWAEGNHLEPDRKFGHGYLQATYNAVQNVYENNKKPLISICIPTYNRADYLKETIESALNQDYDSYEIVIVDDGSIDGTESLVNQYLNSPLKRCGCEADEILIHYIKKHNEGIPKTRNRLIDEAKGEWILWLDSDDLLVPNILNIYADFIQKYPDVSVFYGDLQWIGDMQNKKKNKSIYSDFYKKNKGLLSNLVFGNQLPNPGSCVKKNIYRKYGGFDSFYNIAEDYEFWTRIVKYTEFKHINEFSIYYRIHSNQTSCQDTTDKRFTLYHSNLLSGLIQNYDMKDLFPKFDWKSEKTAFILSYIEIGRMYAHWGDGVMALKYYNIVFENCNLKKCDNLNNVVDVLYQILEDQSMVKKNIDTINKCISRNTVNTTEKMTKRSVLDMLPSLKPLVEKNIPRYIVSLTTYGKRLVEMVHFTIITLLNQTIQPDKVVLWVANEEKERVTDILKTLVEIGLDIRFCEDIRSYKKLIPALEIFPNDYIITADDDVFYPEDWFEMLITEHKKNPQSIVCHRAHGIKMTASGKLCNYMDWYHQIDNNYPDIKQNNFKIFPVGIGGTLFPPNCFHSDVQNKNLFMKLAPNADDIWFWAMAVLNSKRFNKNKPFSIVFNGYVDFKDYFIDIEEEKNGNALWKTNIHGGNDKQLQAVIDYYPEIKRIISNSYVVVENERDVVPLLYYKPDIKTKQHALSVIKKLKPLKIKNNPRYIVSLTSYGNRLKESLHFTLISLLYQSEQPDKIVVWVAESEKDFISPDLKVFIQLGVEVRFCADIKSYKKIIPSLEYYPNDYIITADDDVFYPYNWFEKLILTHKSNPKKIICHRANGMKILPNGEIPTYTDWNFRVDASTYFENNHPNSIIPTGIGGVLYPPYCFHNDITNRDLFMKLSPKSDEFWSWSMAVINTQYFGDECPFVMIKNGFSDAKEYLIDMDNEKSQNTLWSYNQNGGYDRQFKALYDHYPQIQVYLQKIVLSPKKYQDRIVFKPPFLCNRKISVLVPIYNSEKYLEQCLDSILNQTYKNIEIICVNDASIDRSLNILNNYKYKDNRIIVFENNINKGSSQTRKTALQNSTGDFIACIDSDDFIEPTMIERMLQCALNGDFDIVCCGIYRYQLNEDNKLIYTLEAPKIIPDGKISRVKYCSLTGGNAKYTTNKLIKKKIFDKVIFPNESIGEDGFISAQLFYHADKIGYCQDAFYHYRYNHSSLTKSETLKIKMYEDNKANVNNILCFCREKFGDDLSIFDPDLSEYLQYIESLKPKIYTDNIYIHESSSKENKPFISICIPTFNRANYLKEAIESVLTQDYHNYEIVIVDDGSTDNSEEVVRSFQMSVVDAKENHPYSSLKRGERIRYIKKENEGIPKTRNRLIAEASGEWILWLDSDDKLVPNILIVYVEFIKKYPNVGVFYGDYQAFGEYKKGRNKITRKDYYKRNDELIADLFIANRLSNVGSLVKKDLYFKYSSYNVDFKRAEDYDFWVRIVDKTFFKHLETTIINVRYHGTNTEAYIHGGSCDFSYEIEIISKMLDRFSLQQLFPNFDWDKGIRASMLAYLEIAKTFAKWYDSIISLEYYNKAFQLLNFTHSFNYWEIISNLNKIDKEIEIKEHIDTINRLQNRPCNVYQAESEKINPLISICIPTYNRADLIVDTLDSVITQTYKNFEIVVYDDGSTDNTEEVIRRFKDLGVSKNKPMIRYFKKENEGEAMTRNALIDVANGEYILWLDSDDLLYPDIINVYAEFIKKYPDVSVFYGDLNLFGSTIKENTKIFHYPCYYQKNVELLSLLVSENRLPNPGACVKKTVYTEHGYYNPIFKIGTDYDLWTRIAKKVLFKSIMTHSVYYRWHDNNLMSRHQKRDYSYESNILSDILNLYSIKELYPYFDWNKENTALALSYLEIAKTYAKWCDTLKTIEYYNKAFKVCKLQYSDCFDGVKANLNLLFENQEMIKSHIDMIEKCISNNDSIPIDSDNTASKKHTCSPNENDTLFLKNLQEKNWEYKFDLYNSVFELVEFINNIDTPQLSIITGAYRYNELILNCIKKLKEQVNNNAEIIFVNNGCDDIRFEDVKKQVDTYVKLNKNTGCPFMRNMGSIFSKAPILFFIDDDCIPDSRVVISHIELHKKYDILVARGKALPITPYSKKPPHYEPSSIACPLYNELEGNSSYNSSLFFDIGGWDDDIFTFGEGRDLSIRIFNKYPDFSKQIYSPEPLIYHDYRNDHKESIEKKEKLKMSFQKLAEKHKNWDEYILIYKTHMNDPLINREVSIDDSKYLNYDSYRPFISICIATYNRAEYIKEAIESALDQDYENYEIVIVDDGSSDGTEDLVNEYINSPFKRDGRQADGVLIRYIKKENEGIPKTRNRLIIEAKGDWILWLDSDDKLYPNVLKRYAYYIANYTDASVFYGNHNNIGDYKHLRTNTGIYMDNYRINGDLLSRMVSSLRLPNTGACIKRVVFEKYGLYDTFYEVCGDYEFWTRILDKVLFKHIDDYSIYYRVHDDNISTFQNQSKKSNIFNSKILSNMIQCFPFEKLFPYFDWTKKASSAILSYLELAKIYAKWHDQEKALEFYNKAFREMKLTEVADIIGIIKNLRMIFQNEETLKEHIEMLEKFCNDNSDTTTGKMHCLHTDNLTTPSTNCQPSSIQPREVEVREDYIRVSKIDLVYLWVDGNDKKWIAKKNKYQKNYKTESNNDTNINVDETKCKARYANNDELLYSLRSIEKYAPWLNNIFIVTDNQIPKWLDTNHPKIKIIDHKEIIPNDFLPCFNSNILEHHMYKIPNLSEYFIYANDDMMINKLVKPEDFFTADGLPIIKMKKRPENIWFWEKEGILSKDTWTHNRANSAKLAYDKYGFLAHDQPHHSMDAYIKSNLKRVVEVLFPNEIKATFNNRFRENSDIQRVLFDLVAIIEKTGVLKYVSETESFTFPIDLDYLYDQFNAIDPTLFCMNDVPTATDEHRRKSKEFLAKMFPERCLFEKVDSAVNERNNDSSVTARNEVTKQSINNNIVVDYYDFCTRKFRNDESQPPHTLSKNITTSSTSCHPFISICIPTYNQAKYITETIDSLFSQDYENYEIIIVDDGSTDNTEEIIKNICHCEELATKQPSKIRYIKTENSGVPKTRNKLIELANADYIFWIDSDDILMPNVLSKFVKCALEYPDADVLYGNKKHFGYSNDEWIYPDYYHKNELLIERLVFLPKVPQSSLFIKKDVYKKHGSYDPELIRLEDTDLWIRLCDRIILKHIGGYVLYYRIHDTNMSGNIQLTFHTMDLSYNVTMLDRMLAKFSLQQLFTMYNWTDLKNTTALVYIEIGKRYALFRDKEKSLMYYNKTMELLGSDIKFYALKEVYQSLKLLFNDLEIAENHKETFVYAGVW